LRCVWEGAGRVNAPGLCRRHRGRAVQDRRETLMAACQVAGISAAGLLLPCSLIDMAFDTDFLSIAAQTMLAAFACALMLVVWTGQE
jgi:hypothetical protein